MRVQEQKLHGRSGRRRHSWL